VSFSGETDPTIVILSSSRVGHGGMAVLCGGAPAVSGHGKALQGALGFYGDHADLPRLPRVLLEAPAGFVHVSGGAAARAR